jgi:hypothetical protein
MSNSLETKDPLVALAWMQAGHDVDDSRNTTWVSGCASVLLAGCSVGDGQSDLIDFVNSGPWYKVNNEMTVDEIGEALADGMCVKCGDTVFAVRGPSDAPGVLCLCFRGDEEWIEAKLMLSKLSSNARVVPDPSSDAF